MVTGQELVDFAYSKLGTPYVYGCKGEVLTLAKYEQLKKMYGREYVWDSDINKVGQVCCDCSGLISWCTGVNIGSWGLYENAVERYPIDTIEVAPIGATLWCKGHVGIYVGIVEGCPSYIAEDGSAYGCQLRPVSWNKFTYWMLQSYIDYNYEKEVEEEMDEDLMIIFIKDVLFIGLLDREASQDDVEWWLRHYQNEGVTLSDLMREFCNVEEFKRLVVKQAYRKLFDRDPDINGLTYWVEWLKGQSPTDLYATLRKTEEYRKKK